VQTQVVGMEMWAKILLGVVAALNALYLILTGSLKVYLEEKAKHLATKEDLKSLVEEVRQKAVATKEGEIVAIENKLETVVKQNNILVKSSEEIRSKIAGRQRFWELKRETALDIMRAEGKLREELLKLFIISDHAAREDKVVGYETIKLWSDAKDKDEWNNIVEQYRNDDTVFWQLQHIAALAFPSAICEQLERIRDTYSNIRVEIYSSPKSYFKRIEDLKVEQDKLAQMIRDDLGLMKPEEE
jgi:hypothetical protein